MRTRLAAVLAISLSCTATVSAGVIQGTVTPRHRGTPRAAALQARVSDAVVYVENVPEAVERRLTTRGFWLFKKQTGPRVWNMVQVDRRFDPNVLAVAAGDRIAFQNIDQFYHSAFSVSAARRFDLGKRSPGQRDTVTFDRAGVINLHCEIHPDMVGFVVVVPNHVFARTDSLGAFRLPPLPEGRYRMRVWHPRRGELTRTVDVPHRGDVSVALVF